jgi:hypothetical protein
MKLEVATLESIDAWYVVDRYDSDGAPHHVIPSTWAFKCKGYPGGWIKKFKACFCARGDKQLEGIDFFETYAWVVQWTTMWLIFILEILLGLKSKQGDVLCAFLHGELEPGENVYVEMPLGFSQHSKDGLEKSSNWRKPFMDFVKVLEHFGNISLKSSKPVDWNNPNLIPVFL